MTFYDRTKEDARPWRSVQDTQGQAADDAAVLASTATATKTTADANSQGIVVTAPSTSVAVAATRQLTATQVSYPQGTVTWTSLTPARATVNASGLVTGVSAGTVVIRATTTRTIKGITQTRTGSITLTVTA